MDATASGVPGSRIRPRLLYGTYQLAVGAYLAGLLLWLALGVIPPLSTIARPVRQGLDSVAAGGGPLAVYAMRITDHSMPGEPVAWVALAYLFSALNLALGVLLMRKRSRETVPRLLALAFIGTAATFNEPSHAVFHVLGDPPLVKAAHFAFHIVSGVAYLWAVVLFPDGHAPVGRSLGAAARAAVVVAVTAVVALVCWRSSFIAHPPFFVAFFGVLVPIAGMTAQGLHLRAERRMLGAEQSRLLRVALLPALAAAVVWLAAQGAELAHLAPPSPGPHPAAGAPAEVAAAVQDVVPAVFAVVPVVMFVAIVRHHLWDIDVVASRALLTASLAVLVGAIYVGCLAVTGWVLRDRGWAVLVPLVVVACVAEPIRRWCRRLCNRLVFGQRMSPREAARYLVDRFDGVGEADELSELTRAVVQGTRATAAAVWLVRDGELLRLAHHPPAASEGVRRGLAAAGLDEVSAALLPARCWPVTYEGRLLGVVAVTTARGITLTPAEARLLDDLSHHAGLLVANAQLTVDLARELDTVAAQARRLQASREEVVQAQDAMRRQLESDIHDGAQQQLVALLIQLGVLRRAAATGKPVEGALTQLTEVLTAAQETLASLASGGAPLALAERGLRVALQEAAERTRRSGPRVQLSCDGPEPGITVATAVYFCVLEALTNAGKHADATTVSIEVHCGRQEVRFSVSDDGAGFAPHAAPTGSGMRNLAGRLGALGGRIEVESAPGRGTTVRGSVPSVAEPGSADGEQRPSGLLESLTDRAVPAGSGRRR